MLKLTQLIEEIRINENLGWRGRKLNVSVYLNNLNKFQIDVPDVAGQISIQEFPNWQSIERHSPGEHSHLDSAVSADESLERVHFVPLAPEEALGIAD